MFDGPVDALWIESMNTVLDDNKKLCLSSGKVLILSKFLTMMFEVEDLAVASPATVSRCGMVYMEPISLGYKPLFDSFLLKLHPVIKNLKKIVVELVEMFDLFVPECINLVRTNEEYVQTQDNSLVDALCKMLSCHFNHYTSSDFGKDHKQMMNNLQKSIPNLFLFCLIWSVCNTLKQEGKRQMNALVQKLLRQCSLDIFRLEVQEDFTIYDYCYDIQKNSWGQWRTTQSEFSIDPKLNFIEIIVPTDEFIRNVFIIKLLLVNGKNVLQIGPTGTGKSINCTQLLMNQLPENFSSTSIVLSSQTQAQQICDTLFA